MTEYEILTYIANAKDSNGEPIFRPSNDTKEYILPNGKKEIVVCSYYRKVKSKEDGVVEKIEIRAAEHGTTLRTWCNYIWQEPQNNKQNLNVVFADNGIADSDLKCDKFFVVEQYTYKNSDLTPNELQLILDRILAMPNTDFQDPLNKASYKVLTPTDFDGNPLEIPTEGIHPNQLDVLKKYKEQNTENKQNINCNRNMNKKQVRLTESDLKQIVKESVNRILKESFMHQDFWEPAAVISKEEILDVLDSWCLDNPQFEEAAKALQRMMYKAAKGRIDNRGKFIRKSDGTITDYEGNPVQRAVGNDDSYTRSQEMRDPWGGY